MMRKLLFSFVTMALICSSSLGQSVAVRFEPQQSEQLQQGWMPDAKFDRSWIIVRIEFSGNAKTRDQVVRRAVLLREDAPFDRTLLRKSLRRLNQLGLFEPVEEKNVMWQLGKEPKRVDLVFHVKERERQ